MDIIELVDEFGEKKEFVLISTFGMDDENYVKIFIPPSNVSSAKKSDLSPESFIPDAAATIRSRPISGYG